MGGEGAGFQVGRRHGIEKALSYAIATTATTILDNQQLDAENKRVHRRRQNFVRTSVAC
jgi:hypothetical protein